MTVDVERQRKREKETEKKTSHGKTEKEESHGTASSIYFEETTNKEFKRQRLRIAKKRWVPFYLSSNRERKARNKVAVFKITEVKTF